MIPSQIFNLYMKTEDGKRLELRALEMSPDFFDFRVISDRKMRNDQPVELNFWLPDTGKYKTVMLADYNIELIEKSKFYDVYRFYSENPDYKKNAERLLNEYESYVRLKLEDDEEYLTKALTGLDLENAAVSESFSVQWQKIYEKYYSKFCFDIKKFKISLCIDRPERYERFLRVGADQYRDDYFNSFFPDNPELTLARFDHIYIGNQFCAELLPDDRLLEKLLAKAEKDGMNVTFMFPPSKEERLDEYKARLSILVKYHCGAVVNDIGLLDILKNMPIQKETGVFFNRRRKDSRLRWKCGLSEADRADLRKGTLNDDEFRRELINKFGVERFMAEALDYRQERPGSNASILLPLYQTNTASQCTLYAQMVHGSRGRQSEVRNCPHFCEKNAFLYPDELHMAGLGNSLFGICTDVSREDLEGRYDRVVFNL